MYVKDEVVGDDDGDGDEFARDVRVAEVRKASEAVDRAQAPARSQDHPATRPKPRHGALVYNDSATFWIQVAASDGSG